MRVLVTGGAGYIGSITAALLRARGDTVAVLDNFWRGHRAAIPADVPVYDVDLRDAAATRAAVQAMRPDAVLHFAAATLVPESVRDPARYFGINVGGAIQLLEAMRAEGVERLVFSSTAAVYGEPERLPIREDDPKRPINPYGQSKWMVEQMLAASAAAYGLRYAALRYFNVAGAALGLGEDHDPETHVIPLALLTVLGRRDAFAIFGDDYPTPDGTAIRDYVHVLDLADAHLCALDRLDASLGPLNLGTRDGASVRQIVAAVERVAGRPLPVRIAPRRAGDPPALIADATRAREILGWEPTRSSLDEMVGSSCDWFRTHPRGYGSGDDR
ncbi:MAG: UDP-glucose 4-epimerase GalE [Thermomicrobiales bacterium]|nr:UDP-glucose 4-epimerase GalE [Thermomicrobiales bacterium]